MALIFIVAGIIGIVVTVAALLSKPYRNLSERYASAAAGLDRQQVDASPA
jgi:hypothetical protein